MNRPRPSWLRAFGVVLLALFACSPALGADDEARKAAKEQADAVQTALVKGDIEKVIAAMPPAVVESLGGREKAVATAKTGLKEITDKGFAFRSCQIGEPSQPIAAGKELYIVVPFTLEMSVPGGRRLTSKAFLVGLSTDGGKKWMFVDGAPGRDQVKKLLTNLPDKLEFPKNEPPTVIKDK